MKVARVEELYFVVFHISPFLFEFVAFLFMPPYNGVKNKREVIFMNGEMMPSLVLGSYDRYRAVEYAKRWAFDRNPLFDNFAGIGGDCTNFVSQAVYAGSCVMNETPIFGWYFKSLSDRAPAWTGVEAFYDFMTGGGDFAPVTLREGPFGYATGREYAQLGDVIQLADEGGDFYHTLLITGFGEGGELLVTAHTNDALDRPISEYTNSSERIIHIVGVALPEGEELPGDCYDRIIGG